MDELLDQLNIDAAIIVTNRHKPEIDILEFGRTRKRMELMSCSKLFVLLCAGYLMDRKKLKPETRLSDILPTTYDCTVDDLLRHRSGIDPTWPPKDWDIQSNIWNRKQGPKRRVYNNWGCIILWNALLRIDKSIHKRVAKAMEISPRMSLPVTQFGAFGLMLSANDCLAIAEEFTAPYVLSRAFVDTACKHGWLVMRLPEIGPEFFGHYRPYPDRDRGQLICWGPTSIVVILSADGKWRESDVSKILEMAENE